MKTDPPASQIRSSDLITGLPLAGAETIVDLGELPVPGLFFPSAALAAGALSGVRLVRSDASGLLQLDRDISPALYHYYKSGRVNQAHLEHVEHTADEIARTFPTSARILEIGGGAGYLMRALLKRGFRQLHVIDPSAENQPGQEYQTSQGLFPGGLADGEWRFDVIIGQHFLEHSAEPVAVLRAAARLLTPTGQVWIEVPDIDASATTEQGEWLSIIYALHSAYFNRTTLTYAAACAGLDLVQCRTVDHYGKSLVANFARRPAGAAAIRPAAGNKEEEETVRAGIRAYFHHLAEFGRSLPAGLLCWGAAERCLTVLGGCMAGGFKPGPICDSNPDLRGLYLSGMTEPLLAPGDLSGKIAAVLILSPRNAGAIVRANRALFAPDAQVYIPGVGRREIRELS